MVTKISAAAAIAQCDAIVDLVDVAATPGKLQIYNGTIPATVDTPLSGQTLLVEFTFPNPAFGGAVDTVNGAVATANPVAAEDALVSDTATWGWVVDGDDTPIWMGDVSTPAGTGAIKISSVNLTAGIEVSVISCSYTQPKA